MCLKALFPTKFFVDPLALSWGSPNPSLQTLLKITWMNKWLDGQMNKWALSGSLSVSVIYAGEAWWESENWFVAAGVYILFFMRECSSLEEEYNREQMSLNEHVKTIREGLQWMEKPEWSQKMLTWTGYQSGNDIRPRLLWSNRFISATKGLNIV